jgi:hypothetical protein
MTILDLDYIHIKLSFVFVYKHWICNPNLTEIFYV